MPSFTHTLAILGAFAWVSVAKANFKSDFMLKDLIIDSPFQAIPSSTGNSSVSFTFNDADVAGAAPVHCSVEWAVGLLPPAIPKPGFCSEQGVKIWFPEGTYNGVQNLTLALSHSYVDNSVGDAPYNVLTKFAEVNLTYPGTLNYECNVEKAHCNSCDGTSITAIVTRAIA